MAAEFPEIVVGAGEWEDGVKAAGGRWDEPTQANARGERLDCSETAGLNEVDAAGVGAGEVFGSGAVEVGNRLRADDGICMRGEEEAPTRLPSSRSVDPESGIV